MEIYNQNYTKKNFHLYYYKCEQSIGNMKNKEVEKLYIAINQKRIANTGDIMKSLFMCWEIFVSI